MRKKYFLVILFLILAIFLSGCGGLVTPTPLNEAPIITSTSITTATVGELYTYNVNATDPDGDILTYSLTLKPSGMTINSVNGLIEWTPTAKGNYTVVVKVSDGVLDIIQSFTIMVIEPPNQAPVASFIATPVTGEVPLKVSFNASNSSDSDGSIISYAWDFKDGNTGSGETISHTFVSAGSYKVELTVTDNKGATDSATKIIIVTEPPNQSPIASFTATPASGVTPLEVFFDASGSYDPDGNIVSYEWDFKDGNTGSGKIVSHTFSFTGNYNVRLTVTDNEGATDSTTKTIIVTEPIDNEIVYRALCVGVGDYKNYGPDTGDLLGPPYDVDRIIQVLSDCEFGSDEVGFSLIESLKDLNATKEAIINGIASTFSGADDNDISYFYFSGHGDYTGFFTTSYICPTDILSDSYDNDISVNELESALSAIPGTKVVILDSCFSGGFIGKGKEKITISKEGLTSFNDEIINVFFQAEYKGLLTTNQYKVLTSCHYYKGCIELYPTVPGTFDPFGVFTMGLCEGCGYYGNYPADTNLDTEVSLQEAYLYVKFYVAELDTQLPHIIITQDVQVHPNNSTYPIVEY